MGFFDDALKGAVPGGDLTTPIAIAAGALLLHHFMSGSSTPAPSAAPAPAPTVPNSPPSSGSLMDGIGAIIGKLNANGHQEITNSWVGHGPNQPIPPGPLGNALGDDAINQLAAKTGMSRDQLLNGLAAVLPQLINNLTPNGRLPTQAELGR